MVLDKYMLEMLYYDYSPRLLNYGRRVIGDDRVAEDVMQDAYFKLWVRYSGEDKALPQWTSILFSIVRNQCLDHIRKLKALNDSFVRLPDTTVEMEVLYTIDFNNPDRGLNDAIFHELSATISRIEADLSEKTKQIFYMSRIENLKNKEIAQRLDISIKTVEKHITIALKAFRTNLESSGFLEK